MLGAPAKLRELMGYVTLILLLSNAFNNELVRSYISSSSHK